VRHREHERRLHLNRHSRGRRKENRQQTLANWLQNPDAKAQQFRDMVEMLDHDAKVFGHDLRFGYWPRGPQKLLIWELRDGAIMKAVFAGGTDDLVTSVLGELYDDGMFIPEVATELQDRPRS
jgi:hypothetical protein